MLDFRAWIIAGVLVAAAAGAYLIWLTRAHVQYTARSLSAAPHSANQTASQPAKPVTRSLHVDGCKEDFIVSPGEIVEPRVVPGATIDQFRAVYGPETKQPQPGVFDWHTEAFEMEAVEPMPNQTASLQMSLNSGHIVESLDGVELGLDSFATILHKMQDRKVEVHERIRHTQDHWILTLTMFSACGRNFRSEYIRSLPDDPETSRLINRRVTGGNGQQGLIRSDIFMNKVVYDYTMVPANGSDDDPGAGEPSEHD
jgi:hypothetical protein